MVVESFVPVVAEPAVTAAAVLFGAAAVGRAVIAVAGQVAAAGSFEAVVVESFATAAAALGLPATAADRRRPCLSLDHSTAAPKRFQIHQRARAGAASAAALLT